MNSKILSNKNNNFHKLAYISCNKIKSIPKNKMITKKSLNNMEISNYNNSIEIESKPHSKFQKINRHSHQKPILSERVKRNYSNGNKKEQNRSGLKNSIYKINNTEMNSYNNLLGLTNLALSPTLNRKNRNANIKNIFDKNIIINNNNFDKKIIFLGKDYNNNYNEDNNIKLAQLNQEFLGYENDKIYTNSKTSIDNSNEKNKYYPHIKSKNKNNLSLNLSEHSGNKYNFKSLKNLNDSKNQYIIRENEKLKDELNKFLEENMNLKIKMNNLQKNGQNLEINNINSNNNFLKNKKRKNLSFKKNINNFSNDKNDEDFQELNYTKTINEMENIKKKDNEEKKTTTFNSIYDSMKFKIQKRKFSSAKNNKNTNNNKNNLNNINCNNSINFNNGDIEYNTIINNNKINNENYGIEKSTEQFKKQNNYLNNSNSNCNIKYNGAEIDNMNDSNNFEITTLKKPKNNLKKKNSKIGVLNEVYKENKKNNYLNYSIPKCNTGQIKEKKELTEKMGVITKELEKMKNYQNKYNILFKENLELQQKYNSLYNNSETMKKKNEIYLKGIEEQQKKIKERDNLINNLQNTINNVYKKNEEELKNKL